MFILEILMLHAWVLSFLTCVFLSPDNICMGFKLLDVYCLRSRCYMHGFKKNEISMPYAWVLRFWMLVCFLRS